ncbi:MAG: IscA/HesB family protein [Desulfovibrionaceae bacterium]
MIEVTPTAVEQLTEYFSGKDREPIRIYLANGCGGPKLALALDEARDEDEIMEAQGFSFMMDKELYDQAKPLTLDFNQMGFDVKSSLELPSSSGGCSSCSSGCCG